MPAAVRILARRSRLATLFIVVLGLFLIGTVAVLTTAKTYFSIDKSAYILPEELGTWDEIRWGSLSDNPSGWANRYPWLYKMLHHQENTEGVEAEAAKALALAAAADGSLPPLRDNSPRPPDVNSPPEKIPRIIHQTWKNSELPPKWQAIREECEQIHPDYEWKLWTDASSREFIAENYPWFLSVFDSYPYAIQRADAIRYFVLHYYGGVYMDLDIGCNRRLDPLLRFEVILPVTRPVGVSNDLIFSAKGHPFMDQVIHNLVTFNHRYLTHYPTVMFSTGPMFVSASYGLYVDAHGPASPSTPTDPSAGFAGVRVLPKSLYGKNAKPIDVPDAFFKHFYGSSWHAGDADFLIFLRDHGRFLMFIGACVVAFGAFKVLAPRMTYAWRRSGGGGPREPRRNNSGLAPRRSGQWVGLPIQTSTSSASRTPRHPSSTRRHGVSRSFSQTPDTFANAGAARQPTSPTDGLAPEELGATAAAAAAGSSALSVAAPRPQRVTLPLFELDETDGEERSEDSSDNVSRGSTDDQQQGFLAAWTGLTGTNHSGHGSSSGSSSLDGGSTSMNPQIWRRASGVLLLPAYYLSRIGSPGAFGSTTGGSSSGMMDRRGSEMGQSELPSHHPHHHQQQDSSHTPRRSFSDFGDGDGMRRKSTANVLDMAASLLPAGWRGPVVGRGRTPVEDLELSSQRPSQEDYDLDGGSDAAAAGERTPLGASIRAAARGSGDSSSASRLSNGPPSSSQSAWLDSPLSEANGLPRTSFSSSSAGSRPSTGGQPASAGGMTNGFLAPSSMHGGPSGTTSSSGQNGNGNDNGIAVDFKTPPPPYDAGVPGRKGESDADKKESDT